MAAHAAAAAASSLPARQLKGSAHDGQPVPTYSTVLLAVWPHVVSVSVPPSGASSPRLSAYSSRAPGKKAPSPAAHAPAVYMPGVPSAAVDRRGDTPLGPASGRTLASPRQMGALGEGVRVGGGALRVRERVGALVPVALGEGVPVVLDEAEPLRLIVPVVLDEAVPVALDDAVPVPLRLIVPVVLDEAVPVALDEEVPVALDEAVPVWLIVPVALDEAVPVALGEAVPVRLIVPVALDEAVPVALSDSELLDNALGLTTVQSKRTA